MIELSRTVRFCVNDPVPAHAWDTPLPDPLDTPRHNTYAAWPAMRGLGRYYELTVQCHGTADPQTGYFLNITNIDAAVRDHVLPLFMQQIADAGGEHTQGLGGLLMASARELLPALNDSVAALTLTLTPMLHVRLQTQPSTHPHDPSHDTAPTFRMPDMPRVTLSQSYEFSAAHRLHVPELSDAQNQAIFGKCNNPAGHGHNYQFEISVGCDIDEHGRTLLPEALDAVAHEHAVEKLDHKHLNQDVPQFADKNPSVEHIAQVIWDMLDEPVAAMGPGVALESVRVWETGKTVCTYRGPAS